MNKKDILDYIMNTPYNVNWAVLKSLVEDNEKLYKYITETSYNMNRAVLSGILGKIGGDTKAKVGSAIIGESTISEEE